MKVIDAKAISINGFFLREKFIVPLHQRKYEWEKEQITELLNDLNEFRKNKKNLDNEYLLGPIIMQFNNDNEDYPTIVIDGQQRITTLMLIMQTIKQDIEKNKEPTEKEVKLLKNISKKIYYSDDDTKIKRLKLSNGTIDKSLTDYLENKADNFNVYKSAGQAIKNWFASNKYNIDFYEELIDDVFPRVKFVEIMLPQNHDGYVAFESINSKGTDLTLFSLAKNYIYHKMNSTNYETSIVELFDKNFDKYSKQSKDDIIRFFLITKSSILTDENNRNIVDGDVEWIGVNKVKDEFRKIRKKHLNSLKPEYFYNGFLNIDIYLNKLKNLIESFKSTYEYADLYVDLNYLGLFSEKNNLINILSLDIHLLIFKFLINYKIDLNDLKEKDKIIFSKIIKFICRWKLTQEITSNLKNWNKFIPKLINDVEIFSIEKVEEYLLKQNQKISKKGTKPNERLVTKDEIKSELLLPLDFEQKKKAIKYIIAKICNYNQPTEKNPFINIFNTETTIEHLLPQDIKNVKYWKDLFGENDGEKHRKNLNLLGNLTILTGNDNSIIGNKPWPIKITEIEKRSSVPINKYLINKYKDSSWNEEAIKNRNEKMISDLLNLDIF